MSIPQKPAFLEDALYTTNAAPCTNWNPAPCNQSVSAKFQYLRFTGEGNVTHIGVETIAVTFDISHLCQCSNGYRPLLWIEKAFFIEHPNFPRAIQFLCKTARHRSPHLQVPQLATSMQVCEKIICCDTVSGLVSACRYCRTCVMSWCKLAARSGLNRSDPKPGGSR
jgi:hypothetical protein